MFCRPAFPLPVCACVCVLSWEGCMFTQCLCGLLRLPLAVIYIRLIANSNWHLKSVCRCECECWWLQSRATCPGCNHNFFPRQLGEDSASHSAGHVVTKRDRHTNCGWHLKFCIILSLVDCMESIKCTLFVHGKSRIDTAIQNTIQVAGLPLLGDMSQEDDFHMDIWALSTPKSLLSPRTNCIKTW